MINLLVTGGCDFIGSNCIHPVLEHDRDTGAQPRQICRRA
jgi:hypothetical protein